MSIDAAYAGRLRDLGQMPAAQPAATLSEIWAAEWAASGLDTVETVFNPFRDALDGYVDALGRASGRSREDIERAGGVRLSGRVRAVQLEALSRFEAGLSEEQRKQVEPFRDVVGNARRAAREIERQAEEVGARTYGLSGYATSFTAGVARQMTSPVNAATMLLGGPLTGSVPRMLLREAAFGAVAQGVQEPFIRSGREQLGLETSSVENIAQAALGQAAVAGLFRAGAAGFRMLRERDALRADGLTPETAPLAREMEAELGAAAPARPQTIDPAGRVVIEGPPGPLADGSIRLDLPAGVRIAPAPDAAPARMTARADAVTFGDITRGEPVDVSASWSPPIRDVATRLDPDDLEAVALLLERDAVIDGQARALTTVRSAIEDDLGRANATRAQRDAVTNDLLPAVLDLDRRVAAAETALDAFRREPMDAELLTVAGRRDAAQAELDGLTGKRRASPRADTLRQLVAEADALLKDLTAAREGQLREALAAARVDRARAGVALNDGLAQAGAREMTAERLVMLQAEAVDDAARALEAGRVAPPPAAFRATPAVSFDPFQPGAMVSARLDVATRGLPEVADATAAALKALDEGAPPAGPLARAFFADDAMTVPLPRELALDRIARAAERLQAAADIGGPPVTPAGVGQLATRIDAPLNTLPPLKDAAPRQPEPVRTRVKPADAQPEGAPKATTADQMKAARVMATVERELEALGGDARVSVLLPDGREVTSARALIARADADEAAARELDACIISARSGSPQGGSGGVTS